MKYLAILPFLFFAFNANANESFDELFNKASKDGCLNREEIRELEAHPEIGGLGMRPLSINEINEGSKLLFDLNGPNDDIAVYVSFRPTDKAMVRLIAFGPDGCLFGMKDVPDFMAALFLDRMAAE